jgi:hypothetical protein
MVSAGLNRNSEGVFLPELRALVPVDSRNDSGPRREVGSKIGEGVGEFPGGKPSCLQVLVMATVSIWLGRVVVHFNDSSLVAPGQIECRQPAPTERMRLRLNPTRSQSAIAC